MFLKGLESLYEKVYQNISSSPTVFFLLNFVCVGPPTPIKFDIAERWGASAVAKPDVKLGLALFDLERFEGPHSPGGRENRGVPFFFGP